MRGEGVHSSGSYDLSATQSLSAQVQDAACLDAIQGAAVGYFLRTASPDNGLVNDKACGGSPSSNAAAGFALSVDLIAVERLLCANPCTPNKFPMRRSVSRKIMDREFMTSGGKASGGVGQCPQLTSSSAD